MVTICKGSRIRISIIVALEDIGPGDGATVLVPASHKSLVGHPFQQQMQTEGGLVEGAEEMHLKAGDGNSTSTLPSPESSPRSSPQSSPQSSMLSCVWVMAPF